MCIRDRSCLVEPHGELFPAQGDGIAGDKMCIRDRRTAVQKHLRTHPSILTFRSGVYGEEEQGVTIAQLK